MDYDRADVYRAEAALKDKDWRVPQKPWQQDVPGSFLAEGSGAPWPGEYERWLNAALDGLEKPLVTDRLRSPDDDRLPPKPVR